MLLLGIGLLLAFNLSGFLDGSFVTVPIILLLIFLWLLAGAFEGGCRLDHTGKRLIRWRGIPMPGFSRSVAFCRIQSLNLAPGKKPGRRSDTWCHISADTESGRLLIKRFDYRPEARRFAEKLAQEIGLVGVTESN